MAAEEGHMSSRPARPPHGMSEHLIERAFTRSLGARLACLRKLFDHAGLPVPGEAATA